MSRHQDIALPTNTGPAGAASAAETRSRPPARPRAVVLAAALAVALASVAGACGRGDQTARTNAGSASGTTAAVRAASSSPPAAAAGGSSPGSAPARDPGGPGAVPPGPGAGQSGGAGGGATPPPDPVLAPTTTCVRGPATTAPGERGGGEITCSTLPPDGSVSSPPMTDTTIPVDQVPPLQPDATHGVLRGSVRGAACPATAEQCIDLYRLVPAVVSVRGPIEARAHTATFGEYQLLLPPGRYEVVATPDAAGETCVPTTADVVAGEVVGISVDCRPSS